MADLKSLSDKVLETDDSLVKVLREIVSPPGKRGSWLRNLNDRQLCEVYWRLRDGQPAQKVTRFAQTDWGIQRQASTKSLARAVRDLRDKIGGEIGALAVTTGRPPEKGHAAGVQISKELQERANRIGGKIDVLGYMSSLIGIQFDRVQQLRDREKSSIPFRHTDNSVRVLGELLGQYAKMQVDLGVVPTVPQEFNLKVKHTFGLMVEQMGGDGAPAVTALDNFLKWADQNAVHMVQDPATGAYVAKKDKP